MKHLWRALLIFALASPMSNAEELVRFSGHLKKYDQALGRLQTRFCLETRNHDVQSNLGTLWLVGVDLSHIDEDAKILVEGVIHTKLLIPKEGGASSGGNIWEVWMAVKRYKVIADFTQQDFAESKKAEPDAPANGRGGHR